MKGWSGAGLVGLFLWALYLGLRDGDLLLICGSMFILVTLLWAALTVVATGLVLRRALAVSDHPLRIDGSSEEPAMTGWHCRVPGWAPITDFTSTLNGAPTRFVRGGGRLSEEACFARRRLETGLHRRFVITDFLGIAAWSLEDRRTASLRILPTINSTQGVAPPIGMVTGADLASPYSAETGDRLDMRRYRKGDPLRLVLWSIYQRSGHLMVRAPEKAVSQHQRTGLYLFTGLNDPPAAKLARVLLEQDNLGPGWRFGADGTHPWAEKKEQALDALADSGLPETEVRAHRFLGDLARDQFGKCLILITDDPSSRNRKLSTLASGQNLPRLGIEIWVVYDPPQVPLRNAFPAIAGADMRLIERRGAGFRVMPW